jgi:uncharacterized iron-regulated membrane protein
MNVSKINRKTHYWLSVICAVPLLVVIITGLLLQVKKQVTWVQPPTQTGEKGLSPLSLAQIYEKTAAVPETAIAEWSDIDRIDYRPSKGVIKVVAKNRWEIQLDHVSGAVLQKAYRRSDWIESLHDGSFFGEGVKLGVFFPSGLALLLLWLTGMYLFLQPYLRRWRRRS